MPSMLMVSVLMNTLAGSVQYVMVHGNRFCFRGQGVVAARTRRRAEHGSRDCTPNGKQHGEQHQQANANGSHGDRLARGLAPT